ncbi:MAG: PilZ domain-containing protein [Smithella sp.]
MSENNFKITDDAVQDTPSQFALPRIFKHGQLFDELCIEKFWSQKKLINKLNHINFTDSHIFILFNSDITNEQIIVKAYPRPCVKDELVCRLDSETNPSDLEKCNPAYLMIEDGYNTIFAATEVVSRDNHEIKITIPEKCYFTTKRRTKRYQCADINCKVIQGDVHIPGMLIDFTPRGLGIKLTGTRKMKGFDEKKSVLINLSKNGIKLFSGVCKCIRNDMDLPDGRIVFIPLSDQMALFPKREQRNPRQHIVPSFSMTFKHPFFKGTVERDIFDISPAGFSIKDKIDEETLLPGMIIPEITLNYAGILKINCSAQVVYRREDQENNDVQCGLAIVDMDVHSYSKLNHILGSYLDNNARVSNEVDMDALWEFFFDTGFIYGEKYEHLQPYRETFKETYRKLYQDNPDIARHFVYERNGKIYGHIALVHAYEPSWIIHHFAARRMGNRLPGPSVLKQITQYISSYNRFPSARMDLVMTYYRPDNKVVNRIFGRFARHLNDPQKSSLDIFSYLLFKKQSPMEKLPDLWELREALISDLAKLREFYRNASNGLLLSALGLEIPTESLNQSFTKAGFKRECHTYCLSFEGRRLAFFVVNQSDMGLNLSDLLNSIKIIVMEPDALPWEKLAAAIHTLYGVFTEEKIPLLIYPDNYLSSQDIAEEKKYALWILNLRHASDDYLIYMDSLMKLNTGK